MRSDAILMRLLALHPKIIDLSLARMQRLLARLGHPEEKLPRVIHVAGTNGKGSTVAFLRAMMEAAGLKVHAYISPHLVRFHERIRLAGALISESELVALLEECEAANGAEPITFFEITTAAAFLAFARHPADYLLLEVGLGGRLDATNVVPAPAVSVITSIGLDHQQYLGDTVELIAGEKAGILKRAVPGVLAANGPEARAAIEAVAARVKAPLFIAGQDWQSYSQHGRLVYQDDKGLMDLPLPALPGPHQIDNAGTAIGALRVLADARLNEAAIAQGLKSVSWPARLQRLSGGRLSALLPAGAELWLDGGHNGPAGPMVAGALAEMAKRAPKPLILIWGMLNTKDPGSFIANFKGLAQRVYTLQIPDEANALSAEALVNVAEKAGLQAVPAASLEEALQQASAVTPAPRILICGSLYLAGHVLALETGEEPSAVSGAAKR